MKPSEPSGMVPLSTGLRLAHTKTLEEANKFLEGYLPKYNKRFSVAAASSTNRLRSEEAGNQMF